jgi:hypothetical protein
VASLARSQPIALRASSEELNRLQEIARLESEYGMRAHPELPEVMAAIFLRAKQTTDLLRAHGLSPKSVLHLRLRVSPSPPHVHSNAS